MAHFAIQWKLQYNIVQYRIEKFRTLRCMLQRNGIKKSLRSFGSLCAPCKSLLALIHSASNPRMLRTCHHVVPPTTLFIASSRPNAFIRHTTASSQEAVVITRRATRTRCRDRSRTFTKFFECVPSIENWKLSVPTTQESLTGLSSYVVATSRKSRYDIERRIIKQLISSEGHGGLRAIADNPGEIVLDEVLFLEPT